MYQKYAVMYLLKLSLWLMEKLVKVGKPVPQNLTEFPMKVLQISM